MIFVLNFKIIFLNLSLFNFMLYCNYEKDNYNTIGTFINTKHMFCQG